MKFDDIKDPVTCTDCGATNVHGWRAMCDSATGDVKRIQCQTCQDLTDWDKDHRLYSGLTLRGNLVSLYTRVTVSLDEHRVQNPPPHPWTPTLVFLDESGQPEEARFTPVLFLGRDPQFDRPMTLSMELKEKRELRSDRRFQLYERGRRSATGQVLPWDMRWLDVSEASRRVHDYMKEVFEPLVWFGGVQKTVQRAKMAGLKAEADSPLGKITLLTFSSAGRCLVQLDTKTTRVTVIADEDSPEPRSGIQGIDATEDDAKALLKTATEIWVAGGFELVEDKKVGLG